MTTPAAQNELEKLDMLLTKLDAVRYALPEVLAFFTTAPSPSSGGASAGQQSGPQERLQDYRHRVQKAERSLLDLQNSSGSLAGTLSSLLSQADHLKLDKSKLQRLRKDPYTGCINSSKDTPTKLYRLPFPSTDEDLSIDSIEDLNTKLESLVAKYPALKVTQNCQKWNKRSIVLEVAHIATFHVFLTWISDSKVRLQRINVVGLAEKKQSHQTSDYTLWQAVSIYATQAMSRHGRKDCLDLPCLIALIDAYKAIQDEPCESCHRLLHREALHLPTLRVYQAADPNASEGTLYPYHAECYASSGDAKQAIDP